MEHGPHPLPILDLVGVDLFPLVFLVELVVGVVMVCKIRRMYWQVVEVEEDCYVEDVEGDLQFDWVVPDLLGILRFFVRWIEVYQSVMLLLYR